MDDIKKILERYVESIADTLTEWVDGATKLKTSISASSNIIPFDFHSLLRQIDSKLHAFRLEIKKLSDDYKELEETYELKPLSVAYLTKYSVVFKKVEDALNTVKAATNKYSTIVESAEKYDIKVGKYLTPHNQKALDRINKLTSEHLLDVLNDIHLLDL